MYRARLSGSMTVKGREYRYDAGDLIDEPQGTLDKDRFEWVEKKEKPVEQKKKPVKRRRKK